MTDLPNESGTAAPERTTRLLIVDDEADVRAAMARVLRRAGFEVRLADSAERAIAALRAESAELVITDMIMPRQNGAELIRTLKQEFPAIHIVAISGGGNFWPQGYRPDAITTSAYLAAARTAGADAVLAKPFEIVELLELVRAVLAGERAVR